ncbi:uncharacterized protein Pyn_07496 [Prunus yedoensis var. nudiflora]|uniref:Uncharacterized protein n=1 Tax=Prunus yedoensis var. nudiflora TaxID=2094558 RepID=A0A314XIG8_PRUYE|nr:uncharacterized protein Pyn_07496 [Prunus yedoensis var. nudiflora]
MAEEPKTWSSSSQPSSTPKSPEEILQKPQVPPLSGLPFVPNGDFQMLPIMYPLLVPGLNPLQDQEQMNRGAGIYAVPVHPFMGPVTGVSSNTLIPLTYNIPTTRASPEVGTVGEQQGQEGEQQHSSNLAAVIFLFNQEGSRQRLVVLVIVASIVYLYQTGSLTPLVRWLSQGMHRAAVPPHPPRPVARAGNVPPAARQGVDNAAVADGQPGAENENRPADDGNQALENENVPAPDGANGGNRWWGIVKEIQMIVFGFITSLLPGFHNIE